MQAVVLALALTGASAFVAQPPVSQSVAVNGVETLKDLAEANGDFLGKTIGFWDPLKLGSEGDFWGLGNEATIGYLRHAEIKHGRVAMAGFLGFCVQSLPIVAGPHLLDPYRGYVPNVSPQEQWDNIPAIAKFQILVFIGMLESYGEGAGSPEGYVHYTKGGLPGYYPPIAGKGLGQIGLNLYDPFGILPEQTPAEKERGRQVEINNGRLAMLGLFSLLSESSAPGAVPPLTIMDNILEPFGLGIKPYDGDVIKGFANIYTQFDIFNT
ncbi:hypothetical protein CTAYLR_007748 [Chrysophaeum taylorii]|uniref:Plastid light harvesting protein n=1 Tax=Chrysophaeum taylorii TaxID=2483200 RepID=A0AAD7UAF1_9STRA|nr:hypothetical protein CTAYLR_007748 [Chrysophaeum taylorii]